nr:hypothetical protein [uncultured Undibacterium sp.]
MRFLLVLLIAIGNSVIVYFASMLAVADGWSGISTVRLIGNTLIILSVVLSTYLLSKSRFNLAMLNAFFTLPLCYATFALAFTFWTLGGQWLGFFMPSANEFQLACKRVETVYFAKPKEPVSSIAYEWNSATRAPWSQRLRVGFNNRVTSSDNSWPKFPESILFFEKPCCDREGRPTEGAGFYVRHFNRSNQPYIGIEALTADVVVNYDLEDIPSEKLVIPEPPITTRLITLNVKDRRDNQPLAVLRYVYDTKAKRACGETSADLISEQEFIEKAIGLK